MTGLNASSWILLVSLTSLGSTCHGQSSGAGGAGTGSDKDTAAQSGGGGGGDVTLAGVDTSMLTPREKHEWSQYVSSLLAPCSDTPVSIAQCVQEKRACSKCMPAAKFVLRGVRDGMAQDQIEKTYHNRFDADRIKNVPIDGSPVEGSERAPITIIEFADFECPFCAMEAPVLDKAYETHKNDVRFVFKFYPLPAHPHGEPAARAGIAAMNQGKFWEMHHLLFQNRDHLEPSDIDSYAKQIGLDLRKFHEDMQSKATGERIERDKKLGADVGVQGTPTIFINGREYDPHQDLDDWIALELQSTGAAGASATTSGSTVTAAATKDAGAPKK
jgi:protein-disulfide isomerase